LEQALRDKSQAVISLQAQLAEHARLLEDRAAQLAAAQGAAAAQASRKAELEAQLQERVDQLARAKSQLEGLEHRFAVQTSATEAWMQELRASQERLQRKSVLHKERRGKENSGQQSRERRECEAEPAACPRLERQASPQASPERSVGQQLQQQLLLQERRRREAAEAEQRRLAGELDAARGGLGAAQARAEAAEEQAASRGCEFAELRGRLFTAERALAAGEDHRRRLEEALASQGAEAGGAAEDDLRRTVEELRSARLEAEARVEAQDAEIQALRAEERASRAACSEAASSLRACTRAASACWVGTLREALSPRGVDTTGVNCSSRRFLGLGVGQSQAGSRGTQME